MSHEQNDGPKATQLKQKPSIEEAPDSYIDPKTGLTVFTAKYLLNRGYCCNSNCRHCPYKKTP